MQAVLESGSQSFQGLAAILRFRAAAARADVVWPPPLTRPSPGSSVAPVSPPKVVPVKAPVDPKPAHAEAVADAKRLMRLARTAALATLDPASGAPLTTLVGVASDFDGAPLFLMSTLSRHTGHLAADPARFAPFDRRAGARRPAEPSPHHAERPGPKGRKARGFARAISSAIPRRSSMSTSPISPFSGLPSRPFTSTAASVAPTR